MAKRGLEKLSRIAIGYELVRMVVGARRVRNDVKTVSAT